MTELEKCELAKEKGYTYNPITGELRGKKKQILVANRAGYIYCQVIENKHTHNIQGHRLAWYLYYGVLPNNFIDHIDGNRSNNKIENLRDVTVQQNSFNMTKVKGYSWNKRDGNFESYIMLNGKKIRLGSHKNEQDAHNAYLEAKNKYHVIQ